MRNLAALTSWAPVVIAIGFLGMLICMVTGVSPQQASFLMLVILFGGLLSIINAALLLVPPFSPEKANSAPLRMMLGLVFSFIGSILFLPFNVALAMFGLASILATLLLGAGIFAKNRAAYEADKRLWYQASIHRKVLHTFSLQKYFAFVKDWTADTVSTENLVRRYNTLTRLSNAEQELLNARAELDKLHGKPLNH